MTYLYENTFVKLSPQWVDTNLKRKKTGAGQGSRSVPSSSERLPLASEKLGTSAETHNSQDLRTLNWRAGVSIKSPSSWLREPCGRRDWGDGGATGTIHLWSHRDWGSMCTACTGLHQIESWSWREKWAHGPTPNPEVISSGEPLANGHFVFSTGTP